MLSDAELHARSPRDVELYRLLVRTLRQRVRAVEGALNASVWDCAGRARRAAEQAASSAAAGGS